jgi:hypothetical protein
MGSGRCILGPGSTFCSFDDTFFDTNPSDLALAGTLPAIPFGVEFLSNPDTTLGLSSASFTMTYDYTPVATTPEPSSLILFGTSLLGLAPFRRKLFGREFKTYIARFAGTGEPGNWLAFLISAGSP